MQAPLSSIIIPVHNKWELTRACLKSLAATLDIQRHEVIVIDNASTDATAQACAFLGPTLFGKNFRLIRNESNRNFAGASNQGALAAGGEYLVFLNNDTVAESGWHDPLVSDFRSFQNLAASGPLLVYPEAGPFGRTVQHLGALLSPFLKFGHLYQGIPARSRMAKKRRFFQAITAACMMMPRGLFLQAGKFDEGFVNGFEDVDLCARLGKTGMRFTVNPAATVVHYESQTPGRGKNEAANYDRLFKGSLKFLRPDWTGLLEDDGYKLGVDAWGSLQPGLSSDMLGQLNNALPGMGRNELKQALMDNIYWEEGWRALLSKSAESQETANYFRLFFKFFRNIPNAINAMKLGREVGDKILATQGRQYLHNYNKRPEEILTDANAAQDWLARTGQDGLAAGYQHWIKNYPAFKNEIYPRWRKLAAECE